MNDVILTLMFIGILMAVIGYYQSNVSCPKQKIIYKYVDQTIEEAQKSGNQDLSNMFLPMFQDAPIIM